MNNCLLLMLALWSASHWPSCHTQDQTKPTDLPINAEELAKAVLPPVHSRVIGGDAITNEKLGGYLVALRYYGEFVCGGTLVEDRIVVSAAHCFLGRNNKNQWTVEGGLSKLSESGNKVPVLDVMQPSSFREEDMHMDVAVLLLKKPLKGKNIGKLKLCGTKLAPGDLLTVSGWGLIDPKATGPHIHLRSVTVPVVQKKQCRRTYKASVNLTDSMFCAGILGKKDACTFDSGGPLVYQQELCGIVSFGIGCASKKYPGVYTDVYYVKPFIEQSMRTLLQDH